MRVIFLLFNFIILLILFFGCHGLVDVPNKEMDSSLVGTWKYYRLDGSDSVILIYKFFPNNKLEIIEIHPYYYNNRDTTFRTGTYVLPSSNLMFTAISSPQSIHSMGNQLIARDTIVFHVAGNELRLCNWGRSYHQLSGKENELKNGEFYRVQESVQENYSHELYRFSRDTLHSFVTFTQSTKFPEEWEYYSKHKYRTIDVFIKVEISVNIYTMGYNFYNSKLILTGEPYLFKKTG